MNHHPNVLWLSVSPHLKGFDRRLLLQLAKSASVRQWEYCQGIDEPCSAASVVDALYDYLTERIALEKASGNNNAKVHLAGHGVSGIIGLLYARRYPEHVASLSLLSVASRPAINWQAHYYALRQLLPCSREMVLAQMTRILFGEQPASFAKALSHLLAKDLDSNLTLHSLAHHARILSEPLSVPLLVCNGEVDAITCTQNEETWHDWSSSEALNTSSFHRWVCFRGHHFFHFQYPEAVASVMTDHWQQANSPDNVSLVSRYKVQRSRTQMSPLP